MKRKRKKGFAVMDGREVRRICAMGGRKVAKRGHEYMAALGKRGGLQSAKVKRAAAKGGTP